MIESNVFITGVNGFVGQHLAIYLRNIGMMVYGTDAHPSPAMEFVTYTQALLPDTPAMEAMIKAVKPAQIYHLAAISYLPEADNSPQDAFRINLLGTISVLDAAKRYAPNCSILITGSSKEYGAVSATEPIREELTPVPHDFYAISKYSGELIAAQYSRQFNLDCRCTRSFNHSGPGQSPKFVCSDWAYQVAQIEKNKAPATIKVGDISAMLDFCDVRDIVKAYYLILKKGRWGDIYNVCSGKGISLQYILKYLINKSSQQIEILHPNEKRRPKGHSLSIVGNNSKLCSHTGWRAQIAIEKTLDDLFDYWMKQPK
ncbi:GDP-mannose 4,6-dehydratase [Chitinispirillales bacterium ANBcel5]|uniref:GDP-mannose 4,6-dehydratase n=1 Tax=Cellulosispirillum alkaliphilum TaxID=3039283 RepID=UPI002A507C86|nr:GDP-mannose 4,6-dehydratase [Chitinispirillales bacterium ANBcel5]